MNAAVEHVTKIRLAVERMALQRLTLLLAEREAVRRDE